MSGATLTKKIPLKVRTDTARVNLKSFDSKSLDRFRHDKDFNYSGEAVVERSAWERFWSWLWYKISQLFRHIPNAGSVANYLLFAVAIVALGYLIFKALGLDAMQLLRGDSKQANIAYSESLENIHEINFDAEIDNAVSQHNYRLAVRLLYLRCLKQLSDKNLISWQIDKTNAAYLYELTDEDQKQSFSLLTRQFEYTWYGNFFIDQQTFTNINILFQNFKKQLP